LVDADRVERDHGVVRRRRLVGELEAIEAGAPEQPRNGHRSCQRSDVRALHTPPPAPPALPPAPPPAPAPPPLPAITGLPTVTGRVALPSPSCTSIELVPAACALMVPLLSLVEVSITTLAPFPDHVQSSAPASSSLPGLSGTARSVAESRTCSDRSV